MSTRTATVPTPRSATRERWRRHVLAQQRGTLCQREFCEVHGLAISSFARWRRLILAERDPSLPDRVTEIPVARTPAAFVPVSVLVEPHVPPPVHGASISVTLPSGVRIDGIDSASVSIAAALVAAL